MVVKNWRIYCRGGHNHDKRHLALAGGGAGPGWLPRMVVKIWTKEGCVPSPTISSPLTGTGA